MDSQRYLTVINHNTYTQYRLELLCQAFQVPSSSSSKLRIANCGTWRTGCLPARRCWHLRQPRRPVGTELTRASAEAPPAELFSARPETELFGFTCVTSDTSPGRLHSMEIIIWRTQQTLAGSSWLEEISTTVWKKNIQSNTQHIIVYLYLTQPGITVYCGYTLQQQTRGHKCQEFHYAWQQATG